MGATLSPSVMKSLFVGITVLISSALFANVSLPKIFGSKMVLQRGIKVPVWGKAKPGENVTVSFAGQSKSTTADAQGKWSLDLDPMKANAKPETMTVKGENTLTFNDILVGDVWICSGQSNMEWSLARSKNAKAEAAAANYPEIRHIKFPHVVSATPMDDINAKWVLCKPETVRHFTAVGYFFARNLFKELNVPIGLIGTNWGGTRVEPWVAPEGFQENPEQFKRLIKGFAKYDVKTDAGKVNCRKLLSDLKLWLPKAEDACNAGRILPPMPKFPQMTRTSPTALYNGMIHPIIPFAIKGAIWYQGESNGGEGISYFYKKKALIEGWRKLWNQGDFPFYFVQLANYKMPNNNPQGGDGYSKIRDAQKHCLTIPNTGMAVIIDIGEANDIHPKNKQDVGHRLSLWALAKDYGKDIVYSGPLYKSQTVEGNKIRISFDHVGGGLIVGKKEGLEPTKEVPNGKLERFAISGKDKKWYWAEAVIDGDTVLVSSEKVAEPVAVRYAFSMNPEGRNLYNKEGLPASPFKTDK